MNFIDKVSAKNKGKDKKNIQIPKTVQQTIPYIECYENGVMQVENGVFSQTFSFKDISFKTASDEEQERIYDDYMKFLNTLDPDNDITFTFVNGIENEKMKLERIAPIMKGDKYDFYRKEVENILRQKMTDSRNNIATKKYLTLNVHADSVDNGMEKLRNSSGMIENSFKKITKEALHSLTLAERLEMLNGIFNSNEKNPWFEHDKEGNVSIDFTKMARKGLTTKDIIAPSGIKFNANDFMIGERYGQAMFLDGLANWMNTNFISDIVGVNFEGIISINIHALPQQDAVKLIHNQSVNITAEVMEKQGKAMQSGYNPDFISADLKHAKEQIDQMQEDLLNRDQKMFYISMVVVHFASDKTILKEQSTTIKNIANKYMSSIRPLMLQQERGFITALPFGINKVKTDRLLTTESLGVFLPFDELNQFDEGGFYYGINAVNKSMIVYNRLLGLNYNGLILGASGSGKSFSAKREMTNVILNTNANVYIIDPDGEYGPIADAYDGSIIKIALGNGVYINPFDLDIDNTFDSETNPLTVKTDFICGMLETMMGAGAQLTPSQKSIVNRCVQIIYRPYLEHLQELPIGIDGKRKTIDRDYCPTMQNLFEALLNQPQPEAQNLALIMETYTTGSFDTFAHKTSKDIDLDSRLVVYDIKNIGNNLRELALKICMNDVWNKIMENRRKNKWTWFYIDEFHLLLSNNSTAEFLKTVWKRARKFQGVPTGITQNVEELLNSPAARAIINNTSFVYMLNQSAMDRNMLQELLKLSDNDMEYVTNVEKGHGLIFNGKQAIPFEDNFPKNTELYKIMSTNPNDDNRKSA